MLAPRSKDAPSGKGMACFAGSATSSCAVPSARFRAASHSQTRSPTRAGSTSPTATTVPAPSWLGTTSGKAERLSGTAAPAHFPVGRVHSRDRVRAEHLAGCGDGLRPLDQRQHIGVAGLAVDDRSHASATLGRIVMNITASSG